MKVLIISHNPITTYQNMGKTMLSLFSSFKREELCQLYIYPTVPDVDLCSSYFRITDRNVLESLLHFGKIDSRVIDSKQVNSNKQNFFESQEDEKLLKRKKNPLSTLARDTIWRMAYWFDDKLKKWLIEQKPDRVFVAPGEAIFIYDIALKVAREYSIPIVTYVCDEFYFVENPRNILGKIHFFELRKKIEKLMAQTKIIVTISDELNKAYSTYFNKKTITIYTGSFIKPCNCLLQSDKVKGLTYMGNLAYGRCASLIKIGKALEKINKDQKENYQLFIYTRVLSSEENEELSNVRTIKYCGYVTGNDFISAFNEADIFVHVESFESEAIDRVKNSISTKIADILCSGKPLLAFGPKSIASIRYLNDNDVASVATNDEQLLASIIKIFDSNYRKMLSKRELEVAGINHSNEHNSKRMHELLLRCEAIDL